jgi:hypothetical protein
MPLIVLFIVVGDQVPVIPFNDVVGKIGAVVPLQNAGIGLKVGVIILFTIVDNEKVLAHCPAFGVKV